MKDLLACLLCCLITSCASRVPGPELPEHLAVDLDAAQQSWASVLKDRVDDQGRIDFEGLRAEPRTLARVVGHIAVVSPESHPELFATTEASVAWWCDAYNALAMWTVLYSGVLPQSRIRFFGLRKHRVGGRDLTLYELENDIIRKLGDERIHFALNCMVRDCPRLPREPFQLGSLNERLGATAIEFLNDPSRVRVEDDVIRVSPILDWYESDFLAVAPSLLEYIDRYRDESLPRGLELRFMEYDWSLNAQPSESSVSGGE